MAVVPTSHTFTDGLKTSSEDNTYIRDPIAFLQSPPIAELRQTTAQSIPNAAYTPLQFNAEDVDSAGGHDNVTNNTRYTAVYAGWYQVSGGSGSVPNATGRRITALAVNGAVANGSQISPNNTGAASDTNVPTRTKLVFLNVGDYVELWLYQDSGGALNTNSAVAGVTQSSMTVKWVSNA